MSEAEDRERNRVFNRVRSALAPLRVKQQEEHQFKERAPKWDEALAVCRTHPDMEPWDLFAMRFGDVHGVALRGWDALKDFLGKKGVGKGYCDPVYHQYLAREGLELCAEFDPERVDDYEFGVTKASAVISETGTIVMHDKDTASRLGALAPWIHVAIVQRRNVLESVGQAISRFKKDPYVIFATGPSKTADVEGILIEGVHGPGIQVACLVEG